MAKRHFCVVCGKEVFSRNGGRRFCSEFCHLDFRTPDRGKKCWEWIGSTNSSGYGNFLGLNGQHVAAHRLAYKRWKKAIPAGMLVLHTCDNPRCVNPEHLYIGSDLDNMRDVARKNRNRKSRNKGLANPNARLTPADARRIFRAKGITRLIAEKFNVSRATVGLIKQGKRWAHVNFPSRVVAG